MFPKIGGKNPKWMVKIMVQNPMNKWMIWGVKTHIFGSTPCGMFIMENPIKMDDLGVPLFLG